MFLLFWGGLGRGTGVFLLNKLQASSISLYVGVLKVEKVAKNATPQTTFIFHTLSNFFVIISGGGGG